MFQKRNYTDISNKELLLPSSLSKSEDDVKKPPNLETESKAHQMMMKMGWSGSKGLGKEEQGNVDAVVLCENISRLGLGNRNVIPKITKLLDDFSRSSKLTTLAFESDFTKDERSVIHK